MKSTITEALAEIKLSEKKLEKKRAVVKENISRVSHLKDPFEKDGGSKSYLAKELQSIKDIEENIVKIREAIGHANATTTLTVGDKTRSIYAWLVWKKEIAQKQAEFFAAITTRIKVTQDQETKQPAVHKDEEGKIHLVKTEYNIEYADMLDKNEKIMNIMETLDGKLSLKNATTFVEF